jgi:hypothetical protein
VLKDLPKTTKASGVCKKNFKVTVEALNVRIEWVEIAGQRCKSQLPQQLNEIPLELIHRNTLSADTNISTSIRWDSTPALERAKKEQAPCDPPTATPQAQSCLSLSDLLHCPVLACPLPIDND